MSIYNPISSKILIFLTQHKLPIIGRIYSLFIGADVNCKLDWTTKINHPNGVVIHKKVSIGKNVTIMQQVTVGHRRGKDDVPNIKDGVFIGAGAKVLGNVTVGEGARIGANAVITIDIPPYTTAVGYNQIISKDTVRPS